MKIKILVTLMIILSMLMVSAGEKGNFTIDDTIADVEVDVVVYYDSNVATCPDSGSNYYWDGEYEIEGTLEYDDETYNTELNAEGEIYVNNGDVIQLYLDDIDGKLYQNGETQYLYKDNDYKYYGHIESGYNVNGWLHYQEYPHNELSFEWYDNVFVVTKSKPIGKFTLSSPPLGLGYKGSVAGDHIPELFTYRDTNTWKQVVSETYPENHDGPVIITPARIAGEPLIPTGYWETAKGQRISEWKSNTA